jgi:hypothetical protein
MLVSKSIFTPRLTNFADMITFIGDFVIKIGQILPKLTEIRQQNPKL